MIDIIKVHSPKKSSRTKKPAGKAKLSVKNSYDAASQGRRLGIWRPSTLGPNSAVIRDLNELRTRSRDSVRNNAWIAQGVRNYVSNEIGSGITPRSIAPDKAFVEAANKLWAKWSKTADADGMLDFNGMLALASRARVEGGEVFLRKRLRSQSFGLPVPLQLQILEPEFCPIEKNDFAVGPGRTIRAGIEFNGIGQRRAYWLYTSHPGDMFVTNRRENETVPVPADSVIHHFAPLRPGQIRGVPWTVQALIKAKSFDEYDDAELTRKRDKSTFTGMVTKQPLGETEADAKDILTGGTQQVDDNGTPMTVLEPGTLGVLYPGEGVEMFDGDVTGAGYADFVRQQLLGAAAALGIPYEFLSGDLSKINDRTARILMNEYHRIVMQTQWQIVIPQICVPVWEEFIRLGILNGALPQPKMTDLAMKISPTGQYEGYENEIPNEYFQCDWRTDRWDYIHPLQDVQAEGLAIKYGLKSRSQAVAERGESAEEVDEQNSEDQKRAESLGLKYDLSAKDETAPDDTQDDSQNAAQGH